MLEKQVFVIEPEKVFYEDKKGLPVIRAKKRVCAYARVSTDSTDQLHSYQAQISEFTKKIKANDKWEFIKMYADEGLSGTSMKKRTAFLNMIADAKAGKIDLIITKSLSRFARNTVDCLTVIRELRVIDVDVFFEKENIYSSDTKIDFMLTIFSSIAQEEARNISENVKWGFRKRFKEGKVHINTNRFLGYDKDDDGNIIINKKQAKTIKIIFNMYIANSSLKEIATFLTENNFLNGRNKVFWVAATISTILTNEKYCGDAILQKRVVLDYLTHKSVKNNGHAPKYYIKNNHEPIITRKKFELVQELKKSRGEKNYNSRHKNKYPLSGLVVCGVCGRVMNRHYYNYNTEAQRIVLSCKNNYKNKIPCTNKPIDNISLEKAITDAVSKLKINHQKIINETLEIVKSSLSVEYLEQDIKVLKEKITVVETDIKEIISVSSSDIKKDSTFYKALYNEKKTVLTGLLSQVEHKKRLKIDNHLKTERIKEMNDFLNGFKPLSNNILSGIFKAVIALNPKEVLLVISNEEIKKADILKNIKTFKSLTPLISKSIPANKIRQPITYHIIKLGDK